MASNGCSMLCALFKNGLSSLFRTRTLPACWSQHGYFHPVTLKELRYDGSAHDYLTGDQTSNRQLQGITCKVLLAQKAALGLLIEKLADYEWPEVVKTAIRENSMDHDTLRKILVSVFCLFCFTVIVKI